MLGLTLTSKEPPDIGVLLFPYIRVVLLAAVKLAVAESPVRIPLIVNEAGLKLLVRVTLSPILTLPKKVVADDPEIF